MFALMVGIWALLSILGESVIPLIMVGVVVVGMMVWMTVVLMVVVPAVVVGVVFMLLRWSVGRRDGSGGAWVSGGVVRVIPFW